MELQEDGTDFHWRKSKNGVGEVVILINGLNWLTCSWFTEISKICPLEFSNPYIYAHTIKIIKRNWLELQKELIIEVVNHRLIC